MLIEVVDELPPTTADAVRTLADVVRRHDGVEAFGEQTLLWLAPRSPVAHVVASLEREAAGDGAREGVPVGPVGYAQVDLGGPADAPASAELAVLPDARRRGVGGALLDRVGRVAADAGRPGALVWAHGDLPAARALATSAGLTVQRELLRMAVALHDAPPAPERDDVVVRPFVVGADEDAWVTLNARAFVDHPEQGRLTRADVEAREREPWFRADDLLLAERDGRLVASAWTKVEPGTTTGELYALAVDPAEQGTGLGRFMTSHVLAHLAGRGMAHADLFVEGGHAAARATYERAGFRTVRADVQYGADRS
ncbi:mycothiol synthase [Cellulomonas carbonis]|uniref:Mycothiol acetyltransferase n=1 Tax=Cellulomonas carbonis T26 TaxID=947969 RepID=A0A0A0BUV7_9CELL|nr:mycothiol synthase [Cellulomonas carbonis]KGM11492.1 mycothiol acetyltransferase [Cellulomonas carbonis T26]GGC04242.1 mycothiol acetyltransferase [Cellulomonas carbonis]